MGIIAGLLMTAATGALRAQAVRIQVQVTAADPSDSSPRFWQLYDRYPGAYLGSGRFSATPIASESHNSGDTMAADIQTGSNALWLVITQSGGAAYGSYSGTIYVNGAAVPFAGADVGHPIQIGLALASQPVMPPQVTVTPPPQVFQPPRYPYQQPPPIYVAPPVVVAPPPGYATPTYPPQYSYGGYPGPELGGQCVAVLTGAGYTPSDAAIAACGRFQSQYGLNALSALASTGRLISDGAMNSLSYYVTPESAACVQTLTNAGYTPSDTAIDACGRFHDPAALEALGALTAQGRWIPDDEMESIAGM